VRHGEAGAGEEVPHVDGGPADLAGGGAAGGSCRGHAAVQPPAAPGEQVLPVPHGAPWEYPLSSVIVKGGGGSPCLKYSVLCSVQPSEALKKVVFGGQVTEEEAESLNKR
jgi:hypothetical protein